MLNLPIFYIQGFCYLSVYFINSDLINLANFDTIRYWTRINKFELSNLTNQLDFFFLDGLGF